MLIAIFCIIITFAFFSQSILGFGGGLISIPILCLFWPVQDVVTLILFYQLSMGFLFFKTWRKIHWEDIWKLIPMMIVGVVVGVLALKYVPADALRLVMVSYIILHFLRTHTHIDPLKSAIEKGGHHISGFLGGLINASLGGGGPAFILYLKDKAKNTGQFRANINAILVFSNIPRVIGSWQAGLYNEKIIEVGLYAYPGFIAALILGQILHDKIPHKIYFQAVELVLACTVVLLIGKILS